MKKHFFVAYKLVFKPSCKKILEDIDMWLMERRDHKRLPTERSKRVPGTMFGPITVNRRNRCHLKKWIKEALSHRSKQEQKRAYEAVDAGDPSALATAIAAETDAKKRDEIKALREFILNNQDTSHDYRERLREKGIDTTGMRPMGA